MTDLVRNWQPLPLLLYKYLPKLLFTSKSTASVVVNSLAATKLTFRAAFDETRNFFDITLTNIKGIR